MSKIFLIFTLFLFYGTKLFAQCNPDTSIHKAGFYPKTLPDAVINTEYEQTINFKIFKDTVVIVFGSPQTALVDSANIIKVDNMPPGLTFTLNKASQSYTPEEVGCAHITGKPTKTGKYTLDIIIAFYAKVLGFPVFQVDTINTFSINVTQTANIGLLPEFKNIIYPNPVIGETLKLNIENPFATNIIKIFDNKGSLINQQIVKEKTTEISFNYPAGLYNVVINNKCYRVRKEGVN